MSSTNFSKIYSSFAQIIFFKIQVGGQDEGNVVKRLLP